MTNRNRKEIMTKNRNKKREMKIKEEGNRETNTRKRYSDYKNMEIYEIFRLTINWIQFLFSALSNEKSIVTQ